MFPAVVSGVAPVVVPGVISVMAPGVVPDVVTGVLPPNEETITAADIPRMTTTNPKTSE
jgi:hypothetical protein